MLQTKISFLLLNSPYQGELVNLLAPPGRRDELIRGAAGLASIQVSPRTLCDLELLATGAFSPLSRFLNGADCRAVLETMRLTSGTLFPIPLTLPVDNPRHLSERIALRSATNHLIAILEIEEVFEREPELEARQVCGTTSDEHPLVSEMRSWGRYALTGALTVIDLPLHYDFPELRRTPAQVREILAAMGRPSVIAFDPGGPIFRPDEEAAKHLQQQTGASLLIQPAVGAITPGDVDYFTRLNTYKSVVAKYFDSHDTLLSILPLATRTSGPREALWHAIVRRNFGASHIIVQQDAIELLCEHQDETGVIPLAKPDLVYHPDQDRYKDKARIAPSQRYFQLSPAEVSNTYLASGAPLPSWFARPETAALLAAAHPPRTQQGVCIWFTGLPSAGKSTIAEILAIQLMERGRRVTLLDGDVVRTHLSKGLGFSREDRDVNIRRLGFVASEIVRHNGTVLCAAVSPFNATRNQVRDMVGPARFVLVYVSTPADVCEGRDVKGFYAKARAGELKNFTGVDDPYEPPPNPDVLIETVSSTPAENAAKVLNWLEQQGFIGKTDN